MLSKYSNTKHRPVIEVIGPSIAYVPLTKGYFSLIDSDDSAVVSQYNWNAGLSRKGSDYYAKRMCYEGSRPKTIKLHRFLCAGSNVVDHANRRTLDNRRCNLRPCTAKENSRNRAGKRTRKTLKGAYPRNKGYESVIVFEGGRHYLGVFATEECAHEAYVSKAKEFFGDFASRG